jgi:hypothetical protein
MQQLDKSLNIKAKLLRQVMVTPTHAFSTTMLQVTNTFVGQGDDDTCLSKLLKIVLLLTHVALRTTIK